VLAGSKDPGLVMHETVDNFLAANPETGGDPSTLNLASMKNSVCVGSCSWTRTVQSAEKNTGHWNVTASADGFGVETAVSPQAKSGDYNLQLKKGEQGTITVTADTTLSPEGWHFGRVDLDRNLDQGPDLSMPIAVYATQASNPSIFSKSVDATSAAPGDTLTYEINVVNDDMVGPITVSDVVPDGATFVADSETESVVGGSTTSPWAYDGGSNSLSWTGELDVGNLTVVPSPAPFGYFSLPSLGVAPFGCPSNCDDGAFALNVPAFNFNGTTYTQVIWSVNGTVEAGTASGLATSASNQNLPNPLTPNNLIAPYWRDLNLGAGGNWYVATLNAGPNQYIVFEWANVPNFGSSDAATFQIWIQAGASGNIWYTYNRLDNIGSEGTVGVEDSVGVLGSSYFYDGAGTAPAVGTDLRVVSTAGGVATLGFQVTTDCSQTVVNEAELENAGDSEQAIAVTSCP
jgi:uncharacterized repeat protein (TIGR01451 family)